MHLIINNKAIVTPIRDILLQLQRELDNGKLKDIGAAKGDNIPVTCPHHKDGFERNPSCMVFTDMNDKDTEYGFAHCFTCGYAKPLPEFIRDCFEEYDDIDFGKEWLLQRCDTAFLSQVQYLPPIELKKATKPTTVIDESVLKNFEYYHDYMWYRGLSKEIVDLFEVGFDPHRRIITFPVRDHRGKLLFVTGRSVETKMFVIPEDVQKPVYLLYYIMQQNIKSVAICESQLDALYLWSIGIPAVCLFGTGTPYQYELLKKSGIRVFNLYFDGDYAGRKGAQRFKHNMSTDVFVNEYILPEGKDVNNLTKDEILSLECR